MTFGAVGPRHDFIELYKLIFLLAYQFLVDNYLWQFYGITFKPRVDKFLSCVSTLTRDIDIAILSVCPSVRLSVCPLRSGFLWKRLKTVS